MNERGGLKDFISEINLTAQERVLMQCLFSESLSKEEVAVLTDGLDIDTANSNYLLMLAHLGQTRGWELFPREMVPRLRGIFCFYQAKNAIGIPSLLSVARLLGDHGIPVMLIKGIAMRVHYAPAIPRLMSDMDIVIQNDRFDEALDILECAGFTVPKGTVPWSTHVSNGCVTLDTHRWMFKTGGDRGTDLWDDAEEISYRGVRFMVPSPEVMFVHQLDNQSRNLFLREGLNRRMKWVFDCRSIVETAGGLDWQRVTRVATEYRSAARARIMLEIFAEYFPGLVPNEILSDLLPPTPESERLVKDGLRYDKAITNCPEEWEGGLSVKRVLARIELLNAEYRYLKPELQERYPNMSRCQFLAWRWNLDSTDDVVRVVWKLFKKKVWHADENRT